MAEDLASAIVTASRRLARAEGVSLYACVYVTSILADIGNNYRFVKKLVVRGIPLQEKFDLEGIIDVEKYFDCIEDALFTAASLGYKQIWGNEAEEIKKEYSHINSKLHGYDDDELVMVLKQSLNMNKAIEERQAGAT